MTAIYYAKVFLISKDEYKVIVLQTFGSDEYDASGNVRRMIEGWEGIKNFELLKISPRQIFLRKYVIVAGIKYMTGRSKQVKINLKSETKNEAEAIFQKIISNWEYVSTYQIKLIAERN